jgi:hypothetical protein
MCFNFKQGKIGAHMKQYHKWGIEAAVALYKKSINILFLIKKAKDNNTTK